MSSISKPIPLTDEDLLYPSSDGEPVGETDWHVLALLLLREALEDFFADYPDVKVTSDMFLYYQKGDPRACKAPDTMVIKGVGKHLRRSFKTWVENTVPCIIVEITSEKTWQEDLGEKRRLYESLGVAEYFVFDPEAVYLKPALRGFRLKGKRYGKVTAAADGSMLSQELGLRLRPEDHMLRLQDARTGQLVLTRQEAKERERIEKERERQRADALEAEVARLRAAAKRKGKSKGR
jgi:Uma2 family endonuclease